MSTPFETGDLEATKRFLWLFDINHTYVDDKTPLILSIIHGHIHITMYLLDLGCDPNQGDDMEMTPIQYVCRALDRIETDQQRGLFQTLIDHGADLTKVSLRGDTVFSIAMERKNAWLTNECRSRALCHYNLRTLLVSIDTVDRKIFCECLPHVHVKDTGYARDGFYTPFELVCTMISEEDRLDDLVYMFETLLPSYQDQLTYHRTTCFRVLMHGYPWSEPRRQRIAFLRLLYTMMNPLFLLLNDGPELLVMVLDHRDEELLHILLTRLPRHIRFHYVISKHEWVRSVSSLQPLLTEFYQRDVVMDNPQLTMNHDSRFDL